jgi:hypothetical protein
VNNADWWARKLGNAPAPQQQQQQQAQMPSLVPQTQQPMAPLPSFQQFQQPKAASAQQTENCPQCSSVNYMRPTPQIALRCYDCGYPIEQSGSRFGSLTGANVEGPTQSSRGNDGVSNWNPQGIIGRIDG